MPTIRLDKLLANNGYGTRSEVKKIIYRGSIKINDTPCTDPSKHILLPTDEILVDEKPLFKKQHAYLLLHKPQNVVSSTKDGIHQTVIDILPPELTQGFKNGELFPIGRLDIDTEGLLIITSDGIVTHKLTSPKNNIEKTYLVTLKNPLTNKMQQQVIAQFAQGIHISADRGEKAHDCLSAQLTFIDETNESSNQAKLTITEGKYHQVKRMFFALGNEVVALKRLSFAGISLDENVPCGQARSLTSGELEKLLTKI